MAIVYFSIKLIISLSLCNQCKYNQKPYIMPSPDHHSKEKVPYSLMAELYRSWEQYQIPAVFYHYTLSVLPKLQRKKQMLLMSKQIKTLKSNTHIYHRIVNAIEAQQRSLKNIHQNLPILFKYESTTQMQWPQYNNKQLDFGDKGYNVVHQDEEAGILSPRRRQSDRKNTISQLINHIRMYQRVTLQIIYLIIQWQQQMINYGYKQSVIQFQYRKQDYLLTIIKNVTPLVEQYSQIFENNVFFIMKKIHENTQYGLIYAQLKPPQQIGARIYQCLNLLSDHQAKILKFRMLAKISQSSNKYRKISKSTDLHKIYSNINKGKDYIVINDSDTLKRQKVIADPPIVNSRLLNQMNKQEQQLQNKKMNIKLKQKNYGLLINPQFKNSILVNDKTIRKNPVLLNSDFMGLAEEANGTVQHYLSSPNSPALNKYPVINKKQNKLYDLSQSDKFKLRRQQQFNDLKRSNTQDQRLQKSKSTNMINSNLMASQRLSQDSLMDSISVRQAHRKNVLKVGLRNPNSYLNDPQRNKGYTLQRKLQVMNEINQQKLNRQNNLPELSKDQVIKQIKLFRPEQAEIPQQVQKNISMQQQQLQSPGQLSEHSELTLTYEENVKQTQIVKHLRNKVFNNHQTNQSTVDFKQIQQLAKKILLDKDYVTFIRVESRGMRIAWLAVKFVQRDTLTMKRAVMIVYIRKFLKLANFQNKLLDCFVSYGYGVIRNSDKILYEIDILDVVSHPLVKIKYKVSVTSSKDIIKKTVKANKALVNSRILKYYYYSKNSKYHKFCDHSQPNICSITFNFRNVFKITVDRVAYIVGRADKITKLNGDQEIYRVQSIVNDGIDMIISKTLTSILSLQKQDQIDRDSSFDSKMETQFKCLGIREAKIMRKYVQNIEKGSDNKRYNYQQTVISQFITVTNKIPEVRSIMKTKQQALNQKILLMNPPFFMAIASNEEGQTKTLAILQFE